MKQRIEQFSQGGGVLAGSTIMATQTQQSLETSIVGWLMAAAGALILFLLSLGVKDIRDRVKASEELCKRIELLEWRIVQIEGKKDE